MSLGLWLGNGPELWLNLQQPLAPLAPRVVVVTARNPMTRGVLEDAEVLEAEVDVLMRGGGLVRCMAGIVKRG